MGQAAWERAYEIARGDDDEVGAVFPSRYHGTCRACGQPWEPGELIAWYDGEDAFIHAECADADS
jgi:hypothetical protein